MKPQHQKRSVECMRACVASILELPYDSVPQYDPITLSQKDFFDGWKAFVLTHGYELLWIDKVLFEEEGAPLPHGYAIGLARDGNNIEHAVVCRDGKQVFDPMLGGGLLQPIHTYGLFVALEPKGKI